MEFHYKAAQLVSSIPGGPLKDVYWRTWKANVFAALDDMCNEISHCLAGIALRCVIVHSALRQGATFYIEALHPGRQWTPANGPCAIVLPIPASRCGPGPVCWPSHEISPQAAFRIQQIVLGGGRSGTNVQLPKPVTTVSDRCVPVCKMMLYDALMGTNANWSLIPDIDTSPGSRDISWIVAQQQRYVTRYPSSLMDRMLLADAMMDIPFMVPDVISPAVFDNIQSEIESLALTRYRIAVQLVARLQSQAGLVNVLRAYWVYATEQLFIGLAEKISRHLTGVNLQLCFEGTQGRDPTRTFSIQTIHGKKWTRPSSQWEYPMEPVNPDSYADVCNELALLTYPPASALRSTPYPTSRASSQSGRPGSDTVSRSGRPGSDTVSPSARPGSDSGRSSRRRSSRRRGSQSPSPASAPSVQSAQSPASVPSVVVAAMPVSPASASCGEIISVMVPANYPQCGDVLTVASPTTGKLHNARVPARSTPGTQFIVVLPL